MRRKTKAHLLNKPAEKEKYSVIPTTAAALRTFKGFNPGKKDSR